jgi:hypothetical protein
MRQKLFILFFVLCCFQRLHAQKDTTSNLPDASVDYDALFNDLDSFLDSLLMPRSFRLINVSAGSCVYDYSSETNYLMNSKRQLLLAPSFGYFDKSGFGINAAASIVNEQGKWNPYQFSGTVSYDYLKNLGFITGIAATRFFTKDSLNFYTSPLKNDLSAYFSYRKLWFKPAVSVSYGWGTKNAIEERQEKITSLRLRKKGYTRINTQESVTDFNLLVSVRHDFYWLNVLFKKDFFRLTPQINFTSGTQSYGFNQTSNTYGTQKVTGNSILFSSENVNLDDHTKFQPLSVAALLKSEFSIGKFFLQPQAIFNYYIPATGNNITTTFVLNTGFVF